MSARNGAGGPRAQVRAALRAVGREPALSVELVALARRFAPTGWWRRPPFLPLPDDRYWRFRMETAFGDEDAVADVDDVAMILHWSRRTSRGRK